MAGASLRARAGPRSKPRARLRWITAFSPSPLTPRCQTRHQAHSRRRFGARLCNVTNRQRFLPLLKVLPGSSTTRRSGRRPGTHLPWYTWKHSLFPFNPESIKANLITSTLIAALKCTRIKTLSIKTYLTEQSQMCTWHHAYRLICLDGTIKCINVNSIHKENFTQSHFKKCSHFLWMLQY